MYGQKNTLRWWEGLLMALMALLLLSLALGARDQEALAGQVVRLHVLANSDSPADQALKLQVRDAVLAQAQPMLAGATSQEEAEAALTAGLDRLAAVGQETVTTAGQDYPVQVSLTRCWFPTRSYEDFSLPAGYYQALRVEIGAAAGQNWWCVVYPPLCSMGVTETATTTLGLTGEEISLITQEDETYVLRFQCADWWGRLTGWLGAE